MTDILAHKRSYELVEVRHIGMWLAYTGLHLGYSPVGRSFRRDHTSVLHAVEKVNTRRQRDEKFCIQTDNDLASFKATYCQEAA
jgi:chromosomal replication initiation ATPase DnaA